MYVKKTIQKTLIGGPSLKHIDKNLTNLSVFILTSPKKYPLTTNGRTPGWAAQKRST